MTGSPEWFRLTPLMQALRPGFGLGLTCLLIGGLAPVMTVAAMPDEQGLNQLSASPANVQTTELENSERTGKQPASLLARYLNRQQLLDAGLQNLAIRPACHGRWVLPIASQPRENVLPVSDATTELDANYAYYHPAKGAELSGNVVLTQPGRLVSADRMTLNANQTEAIASGNVSLSQPGLVTQGDRLVYNLQTQSGSMQNSQFVSEEQQAHGSSERVERNDKGHIVLTRTRYTTCEPDNEVWRLDADSIVLNPETGRGQSRDSTLYVHNVPVLTLPFFDFPIDDRRLSGILTPRIGYTEGGGLEAGVPYYFNLAPNYDATLTPRYFTQRQLMLDGEFRYLSGRWGSTVLSGGFLPSDTAYGKKDRKRASLLHTVTLSPELEGRLDYNYVSDKDYFTDLGNDPLAHNTVNQERSAALKYRSHRWPGLDALLRAQTFQTVDPTVKDVDKPYSRLPQLLINYSTGSPLGWEIDAQSDSGYFKKSITDGSALESSGLRLYNSLKTRYNYRQPWGYVIPAASVRSLVDFYDKDSLNSQGLNQNSYEQRLHAIVPQFDLDSGLYFERLRGHFIQTLEPRLFYSYAPYEDQSNFPNFDTTAAGRSFSQLFSSTRFAGHDRLDDNHFLSLGITHRLYENYGFERARISLGQRFYWSDRRVTLTPTSPVDRTDTSGPAAEISAALSSNLRMDASAQWLPSGDNAHHALQLNYTDQPGSLYTVSYSYEAAVTQQNQKALKQATAAVIQPFYNQWRFLGYGQYDLNIRTLREVILGVDYDSCCWQGAIYARRFYNDLDDPRTTDAKNAIMLELTFKGLAGFSGDLLSLLQQKILGYSQVQSTWNTRSTP